MLPHANFLQADVVLEHLAEVDGHRLADGLVDWVFNVELLEGVVGAVQDRKDTNNTIVVHLIIAQVQTEKLIMSEK